MSRLVAFLPATCALVIVVFSCAAGPTVDETGDSGTPSTESGSELEKPTNVFFVTNRTRSNTDVPEKYFGDETGSLHYGSCTVQFSPSPGLKRFSRKLPFYMPPESQELTDIQDMDMPRFWSQLVEASAVASDNVVVFIHGYSMDFSKGCRRTALFQRELGSDAIVVLFSWPSDGKALKYRSDEADLASSVPYIQEFLRELVSHLGPGKANVVAHSMGARGIVNALAEIECQSCDWPLVDQLVLAAPDMAVESFRERLPKVLSVVSTITLYVSERDTLLKLSHRIHGQPRLGQGGAHLTVLDGVETIDVSENRYEITGHQYNYFNPQVIADMVRLLVTGASASERPGLEPHTHENLQYWKMVPAES